MTGSLSRIFSSLGDRRSSLSINRHLPMINSISTNLGNFFGETSQIRSKTSLMNWYESIPELTAMVNKVASDTVTRFKFKPVNPNDTSRNKILRSNRFSQEVMLRQVMDEQMVDMLVTGEGYGWKGKLPDERIRKELINSINSGYGGNLEIKEKHRMFEELYLELKQNTGFTDISGIDEDLLRPRKYRVIPSETVEIIYDQYDIIEYRHVVGMNDVIFKPEEIIRYKLKSRRGKPNGFCSVKSILVQLELLRQMWQNQLSLHKNGGVPDYIFILKNINPNNVAYARAVEELRKYTKAETKHGNMVVTGDWDVQMLEQLDSMQFKELGLYITGLIAMQWGIPRSSIPFIVGGTNTTDDTGGNSEKGYWEVIKSFQDMFSETMNSQLWIPYFGTMIEFENSYLNYDVQKETALTGKYNNILTIDNILGKNGKQLNLDTKIRLLDLTDSDIEDMPLITPGTGLPGQSSAVGTGTPSQLSPSDALSNVSKDNVRKRKRNEQQSVISSRGMKPTGV